MTITLQARPRAHSPNSLATPRCPLCRDEIRHAELRAGACGHCPECETRYHRECFAEFGGCSTLGCSAYRQPLQGAGPRYVEEACSTCWEDDPSGFLRRCPGCEVRVHAHCLDQEGCQTRGCRFEQGPARVRPPRPARERRRVRQQTPTQASKLGVGKMIGTLVLALAGLGSFLFAWIWDNYLPLMVVLWLGSYWLDD